MTRRIGIVLLLIFLTGCGAKKEMQVVGPNWVEIQLGQAAEHAHADLAMLAKLKGQGMQPLLPTPSPDLEQLVTIAWTGPVKGALETICLKIGYKYREIGNIPAQSATIIIKGTNRKAYDLLEDIAWQTHPRAALRVDAINRVLTLAYGG